MQLKQKPLVFAHSVRHQRQRADWDCGLACVQMLLPIHAAHSLQGNTERIAKSEGFGKSTWTIDLCYVLRHFGTPHTFFTRTLGAAAEYRGAAFYAPAFDVDAARVNRRFAAAQSHGLDVRCAGLPLGALLARIRCTGPAIVLTNDALLACDRCQQVVRRQDAPYQGHYVVLCGYNLPEQVVYYRNPAKHDHHCVMSLRDFDAARKSFGTDEDVIFVRGYLPDSKKEDN